MQTIRRFIFRGSRVFYGEHFLLVISTAATVTGYGVYSCVCVQVNSLKCYFGFDCVYLNCWCLFTAVILIHLMCIILCPVVELLYGTISSDTVRCDVGSQMWC